MRRDVEPPASLGGTYFTFQTPDVLFAARRYPSEQPRETVFQYTDWLATRRLRAVGLSSLTRLALCAMWALPRVTNLSQTDGESRSFSVVHGNIRVCAYVSQVLYLQ